MSDDELKALAKEVALTMGYVDHLENEQAENVVTLITKALERVQQDAFNEGAQSQFNVHVSLAKKRILESQIEWPNGKEIRAVAEKERASDHCRASFIKGAKWVRDNVKLKPNEPILLNAHEQSYLKAVIRISELEKENAALAARLKELNEPVSEVEFFHCTHGLGNWADCPVCMATVEEKWRACEKKLKANEPVNDGRSVCAHNNPDPMLCKECKGKADEWTMDKRADQEAIF